MTEREWFWGSLSLVGICCSASVSAPQRIKYNPLCPHFPSWRLQALLSACVSAPPPTHTHTPSIPLEPRRVPVSRPWSVQLALVA